MNKSKQIHTRLVACKQFNDRKNKYIKDTNFKEVSYLIKNFKSLEALI